jgi:hypothetical protein
MIAIIPTNQRQPGGIPIPLNKLMPLHTHPRIRLEIPRAPLTPELPTSVTYEMLAIRVDRFVARAGYGCGAWGRGFEAAQNRMSLLAGEACRCLLNEFSGVPEDVEFLGAGHTHLVVARDAGEVDDSLLEVALAVAAFPFAQSHLPVELVIKAIIASFFGLLHKLPTTLKISIVFR